MKGVCAPGGMHWCASQRRPEYRSFLRTARVPGGDRGARPISLLTMKCIVIHTCQLPFLSQKSVGCDLSTLELQVTRPSFLFPIFDYFLVLKPSLYPLC